jgi:hypothetical protein
MPFREFRYCKGNEGGMILLLLGIRIHLLHRTWLMLPAFRASSELIQ